MLKEDIHKIKFRNTLKTEFEVTSTANIYKNFEKGRLDFDITKFHRLQFNMILLVENEEAEHFVDFQNHKLKRGDILLVGENHVHAFSINKRVEGRIILFTNHFIEVNKVVVNPLKRLFSLSVVRGLGNNPTIMGLFNILKEEYKVKSLESSALYRYLLGSLLTKIDIEEEKDRENEIGHVKTIANIDRLIKRCKYKSRDSKKYAKEAGYSYKQLNIICKSVTGNTLKSYIDDGVVMEMKRQIVANDMSIKELCIFFDFDEETNLVKYFKRNVGKTPRKFKEEYRAF